MRSRSELKAAQQAQSEKAIAELQPKAPDDEPFELPPAKYADVGKPGAVEPPGVAAFDRRFDPPKTTFLAAPPSPEDRSAAAPPPEMARIIESVFQVDVEATWKRLHTILKEHENPRAYDARKLLREVDDRCREAHKLYCSLKAELERYKGDVEATQAAMRSEAASILEDEKAEGTRKKAITEADIKGKMVELHPDEFRATEQSVRRFSLAVEHAEHMVKVLSQKSRSLQVEVGRGVSSGADD